MTREDIIRMAREADLNANTTKPYAVNADWAMRFAALVAAAEREACAKVCDELADDPHVVMHVATVCAENIRARGQA